MFHIIILDTSITALPRAWDKKYFTVASVSWIIFENIIIGINENIFSSREAQIISQFLEEIAINALKIIVLSIIKLLGIRIIRSWMVPISD